MRRSWVMGLSYLQSTLFGHSIVIDTCSSSFTLKYGGMTKVFNYRALKSSWRRSMALVIARDAPIS